MKTLPCRTCAKPFKAKKASARDCPRCKAQKKRDEAKVYYLAKKERARTHPDGEHVPLVQPTRADLEIMEAAAKAEEPGKMVCAAETRDNLDGIYARLMDEHVHAAGPFISPDPQMDVWESKDQPK